ncbi:type II secretion system F family protein [Verminephrobacter eiseniae]|uniref:type II secretion system F family protein n=1 Tax=Verminephrobacter eiseniae TaxID=364317 RepID=UPI0010DC4948|nr:type II secretion system F family protein [Verminephrobacter eiseniae]KAB7613545.1 type II secretion system F family protein [Verminephrobacter sp. Larva24]MCW5233068.1 type II secretion system F family protein [Verminephrobacter eiseniae]MCW5261233.1 type II secretion system F family protein [Verminephrobacter eiseniae]MCW5295376.1 type II secretion system F family protein [Verminephrobacter eiseniae]MCW8187711.1 type II secretion system F family protein [Verminephrobacter eiseniae]
MESSTLILTLIAAAAGLSAALLAWLIGHSMASVRPEDRSYKDPPPLAMRLLWWPIQWIGQHLGPRLGTGKSVRALQLKLRQAGLDYTLDPAQFIASRIVSAFVAAALLWWAVSSFDGLPIGAGAAAAARRYIATGTYLQAMAIGALLGWFYPALWLKDRIALRRRELLRMMPFFLDIITLCVEAGLNMHGAIAQAVAKGPQGTVREEFQRVLRDVRAGKARTESLRDMAERLNEPGVTQFVMAVIQAERMGMNLGPVLRAQADQQRSERFLRAEKLAMEAPVKMLLPLIAFIFPCTFIVLLFPIAMKFINTGL